MREQSGVFFYQFFIQGDVVKIESEKLDQQFSDTDVITKSVKLSRALVEVSRHFLNDTMGMGNSYVLNKQFANVCPMGAFQSLNGSSCSSHNFF